MGNRVMKVAKDRESGAVTNQEGWTITHYVMDASGTPMATYKTTYEEVAAGDIKETTKLMDHPIYGSSREGLKDHDEMIYYRRMEVSSYTSDGWFDDYDITETDEGTEEDFGFYQREVGNKKYELSNHLGNVLAVVSDKKLAMDTKKYSYVGGTTEDYSYDSGLDVYYYTPSAGDYELITGTDAIVDYYEPDVQSYSDYYPFGMEMPNRHASSENYRYGFNGMEKDDEVKGQGNSFTTQFRQYDPRLGRWLSLDPVVHPHMSPYNGFDNNPIYWADPSGADGEPSSPGMMGDGQNTNTVLSDLKNLKRSNYKGTGNVQIINIESNPKLFGLDDYTNLFDSNWDYIFVNRLEEASEWLDNNYGKDNKKINNLIMHSHGGGGWYQSNEQWIGVIWWDDALANAFKEDFGHVKLKAYDFAWYMAGEYDQQERVGSKSLRYRTLDAYSNISGYLDHNASVVIASCHSGVDKNLSMTLSRFFFGEKGTGSLYMNRDGGRRFSLLGEIVAPHQWQKGGFTKTVVTNGDAEFIQKKLNLNVKFNGDIKEVYTAPEGNDPSDDYSPKL